MITSQSTRLLVRIECFFLLLTGGHPNSFTHIGASALAKALLTNQSLTLLDVARNKIGEAGVQVDEDECPLYYRIFANGEVPIAAV